MRRTASTAIMLLTAALLAALTALGVTSAHPVGQANPLTPPPPPMAGTPIIGTPPPATPSGTPQPAFRTLSKKQKQQILRIVQSDRTVKRLLKKQKYTVKTEWIWSTEHGGFLGGVVTLRLKKPVTLSGTWLDLAYDCSERTTPPYGRVPFKATYKKVTEVTVYVDLGRKQIAGTRPLGVLSGRAIYPPGYKSNSARCGATT